VIRPMARPGRSPHPSVGNPSPTERSERSNAPSNVTAGSRFELLAKLAELHALGNPQAAIRNASWALTLWEVTSGGIKRIDLPLLIRREFYIARLENVQ
jgi:hypothetical protein